MSLDPQLADWLRLCHAPGIGPIALRKLLAAFGLPHQVFTASADALAAVVGDRMAHAVAGGAPPSTVDRALVWAEVPGRRILTWIDTDYPQALLDTPDPPPLLYVEGRVELLNRPAVAIVGSRNASVQGLANAEAFARELSAAGLTIVSGLALGIDGRAHRGGLDAAGSTIGVVGTGLDLVYPRRHRALFEAMRVDGAIVADCPLGTPPLAGNFPRRNRLISG
ncbi:MAG: DNA-processing protein DprA, partial [Burkholderiales bacterium]